ncbi:MAG: hypothetical protein ACYSU0_10290 [Planctomycetota bacterium]
MIRNLALVSAAICGALAGCRGALDTESALPPSRVAPSVDSEAYVKELEALQAAGKLEKIEVDRDEDGETDLVFWCRDGALVKLDDLPHIEKVKLDLPPLGAFDRIEFRRHSFVRSAVNAPGEIALFYQCLKEASKKEYLGSADYFGPDGELVCAIGNERSWSYLGPGPAPHCLLFMKGDREVLRMIGMPGRNDFKILREPYPIYFRNKTLQRLIDGRTGKPSKSNDRAR